MNSSNYDYSVINCVILEKAFLFGFNKSLGDAHISDDELILNKKDRFMGEHEMRVYEEIFIPYKDINNLKLKSNRKITINTSSQKYKIEKYDADEEIKSFFKKLREKMKSF